ncbi:MAG: hypothetical protein LBS25_02620 [Candidatus Symbiothrix sp.]|jgi:hypothetical protein|nr:hypothetical protein [Candidatus Symbiothrix sp.]
MNKLHFLLSLLFGIAVFTSCEKEEPDKTALISGLWIQEILTEEGVEMPSQNLSLLIESNGVYRTYAKDAAAKEHFGAWTITDNTWLEITTDIWRVASNPLSQTPDNQWAKNHILTRFTILSVSDKRLEIRLKTYAGEQKYSTLFVEGDRPLITESNEEAIQREYKTLKTYIYTFRKS